MSLRSYVEKLFWSEPQREVSHNVSDIFQTVYGRLPNDAELNLLTNLTSGLSPEDRSGMFRATINTFDHQKLSTSFTVRFSKDDIQYVTFPGFELAIDNKDISVSMPLFRGEYEHHLFRFFSKTLKPGMVFMDIGANIGFYSMLAASKVGSSGKVISFEPNTENGRLIMLGMYKNKFQNISLYPFALGDKTGYALFSQRFRAS